MSRAIITEGYLSDIGDALREQLGTDQTFLPSEMGPYVRSIQMSASGVYECYVVGSTPYASGWLSTESGGAAITPSSGKLYMIVSESHKDEAYRWNGSAYELVSPSLATQAEAETGTENTKYMSPLRTSQAISERIDSALDQSSSNAIANSAVKAALDQKANTSSVPTKTSDLTNDSSFVSDSSYVHTDSNFTASEKSKLSGIESGANKTVIDASLSASSSNPVQNSAIKSALDLKADLDSPALAGTPTAPTATEGTSTTQIATTAFVQQEISANAYELPLMSPDTRGGAKLGDGLAVDDGTLHVGQLAKGSTGEVYGPLASVTAKGHAEQASTTGKNLTNIASWSNASTDTRAFNVYVQAYKNGSFVSNVASTTPAIGENSITFTTVDADAYYVRHSGSTRDLVITFNLFSSAAPEQGSQFTLSFVAKGLDTSSVGGVILENIQLELGSTATEYEPYTGGAPSPSPDYPQEIQVVRGRNLLDASLLQIGVYSAVNGMWVPTNRYVSNKTLVPVTAGRTYTMSGGYILDSNRAIGVSFFSGGTYHSFVSFRGATQGMFTVPSGCDGISLVFADGNNVSLDLVPHAMLTLGSVSHPYVPYGDYVGLEVQGKNLLDILNDPSNPDKGCSSSGDGTTLIQYDASNGGYYTANHRLIGFDLDGGTYTLSIRAKRRQGSASYAILIHNGTNYIDGSNNIPYNYPSYTSEYVDYSLSITVLPNDTKHITITVYNQVFIEHIQLERGTEATEYEPYHHSTTPIPLPQRGWVGGLPDGTSDVLSIDSAGKVEWELEDEETTTAATDGVTGTIGVDALSTTGQIADGATVLYKLATPITEECGYVDLPDISASAQVSIPELEDFGCTFWVDENGTIHAAMKQWYDRAHSEYADRIQALEEAVAEIVAG